MRLHGSSGRPRRAGLVHLGPTGRPGARGWSDAKRRLAHWFAHLRWVLVSRSTNGPQPLIATSGSSPDPCSLDHDHPEAWAIWALPLWEVGPPSTRSSPPACAGGSTPHTPDRHAGALAPSRTSRGGDPAECPHLRSDGRVRASLRGPRTMMPAARRTPQHHNQGGRVTGPPPQLEREAPSFTSGGTLHDGAPLEPGDRGLTKVPSPSAFYGGDGRRSGGAVGSAGAPGRPRHPEPPQERGGARACSLEAPTPSPSWIKKGEAPRGRARRGTRPPGRWDGQGGAPLRAVPPHASREARETTCAALARPPGPKPPAAPGGWPPGGEGRRRAESGPSLSEISRDISGRPRNRPSPRSVR